MTRSQEECLMENSLLYPISNCYRVRISLDGLWKFQFDPEHKGLAENWKDGLKNPISMPVPASFSDLFTTARERDYCGDFWYETEFFVPEDAFSKDIFVRFGSVTHRAVVFCNGIEVGSHEGGFLPFSVQINKAVVPGKPNRLVVKANNELSETTIPCGRTITLSDGRKAAKPFFDFFNYAGIHRSVWLLLLPQESITDYSVDFRLEGQDAFVNYQVKTNGAHPVEVALYDQEGELVARASGNCGTLHVRNARLWKVRDAYLYRISIVLKDGDQILDEYSEKTGIRTVEIQGTKILINHEPVYLKGFGKHEDFDVLGRAFNWAVAKRDFECMKWTNANCFRTSHYPYAEEWYQMADEEGFLIIDEVPAVGMQPSLGIVDTGPRKYKYFFEAPSTAELLEVHKRQAAEMICRDKNHPSVIAWSLFNEPETISSYSKAYFSEVFDAAKDLDPQKRPRTGALELTSSPDSCQCFQLCDFICLNRYYGWYLFGGVELETAKQKFMEEMEKWGEKAPDIPFVFTEFGADTLGSEHKLPGNMWSQEYQVKYMQLYFDVFDSFDFIQGELVWNFADFMTSEGIIRVNGNKKGIFTRDRQPKDAAYLFRERWGR